MVSFTQTLQQHVTNTSAHYVLSIPREIAQTLGLGAGGLCSIEIRPMPRGKTDVVLQAYKDTQPAYTKIFDPSKFFDPSQASIFDDVPIPPRTRGPSSPWGQGRIYHPGIIRELRAARLFLEAELTHIWPSRRGPKRKRRR